MERFLEPMDVVMAEHLSGAESPLVTLRPERVTRARVYHQERIGTDGFTRSGHDGFVGSCIAPAKRAPADLECPKSLRLHGQQFACHALGLAHQQGSVGTNTFPVPSAKKAAD